jgi:hypothetical protein
MEPKLPVAEIEAVPTAIRIVRILGVSYEPMDPIGGVLNLG